jgi:hypothetical protein
MKFMTTWTLLPGTLKEAASRFLAGQAQPSEGVTVLGRWHKSDCSGGYTLFETNNPVAMYADAAVWADVIELRTVPVIEDADAGPVLAKTFGK